MFQRSVVEKRNTHILCQVTFFSLENRAFYEVMWKNTVEPERPRMTLWSMRISRWIPKAIDIHLQYVILIAFPL